MAMTVHFAYVAMFEMVAPGSASLIASDAMCDAFGYDLTADAEKIFKAIELPKEPGVFRAWATGKLTVPLVVLPDGMRPDRNVEIGHQLVKKASREALNMLYAMAQEAAQQAAGEPT